jgi:hypothetical protein
LYEKEDENEKTENEPAGPDDPPRNSIAHAPGLPMVGLYLENNLIVPAFVRPGQQ